MTANAFGGNVFGEHCQTLSQTKLAQLPTPTNHGTAVIAHSQIVVARAYRAESSLPAGFDYADIAVLDWIAAEGRRLGRGLQPI
jgi:hypothetical protein